MRIVHVTGYYVRGMAYQENLLPAGQAELGHDVAVITGTNDPDFGFNSATRFHARGQFEERSVTVVRLPHYVEFVNRGPVLRGIYRAIESHRPDILFIHDVGYSLLVGLLFKLRNPSVRLHFDCHSDDKNARQSWIGPYYHGLFKLLFWLFGARFEKVFAVAPETVRFINNVYGVPLADITLLPLPGDATLLTKRNDIRPSVRGRYGLSESHYVFIHTGKLPGDKRTEEVLSAFSRLKGDQFRLWIAGFVDKEFRNVFDGYLSSDDRIIFLGWMDAEELRKHFISSDLLVAPGSLSNTFIDAICCGLPVLLDDTLQGRYLTQWGNGITVSCASAIDLACELKRCVSEPMMSNMRLSAVAAAEHLDYREIARVSLSAQSFPANARVL
jgi:hypothetical protein